MKLLILVPCFFSVVIADETNDDFNLGKTLLLESLRLSLQDVIPGFFT